MVSKAITAVILIVIIIALIVFMLSFALGLGIISDISTLQSTTILGCNEFRNSCVFLSNDILVSDTVNDYKVMGDCLIEEFQNNCINLLVFDKVFYDKTEGANSNLGELTVFERGTPRDSLSASLEDFQNECRLTDTPENCEDPFTDETGTTGIP